jgi:hypothetical protein
MVSTFWPILHGSQRFPARALFFPPHAEYKIFGDRVCIALSPPPRSAGKSPSSPCTVHDLVPSLHRHRRASSRPSQCRYQIAILTASGARFGGHVYSRSLSKQAYCVPVSKAPPLCTSAEGSLLPRGLSTLRKIYLVMEKQAIFDCYVQLSSPRIIAFINPCSVNLVNEIENLDWFAICVCTHVWLLKYWVVLVGKTDHGIRIYMLESNTCQALGGIDITVPKCEVLSHLCSQSSSSLAMSSQQVRPPLRTISALSEESTWSGCQRGWRAAAFSPIQRPQGRCVGLSGVWNSRGNVGLQCEAEHPIYMAMLRSWTATINWLCLWSWCVVKESLDQFWKLFI